MYQFDEGTGAALENVADAAGTTGDATISGSAWAATGIFNHGDAATLTMAKSGTQTINCLHMEELYNFTVNNGSTTQINTLNEYNGLFNIKGNLVVEEKLKPHSNSSSARVAMLTGGKTLTITEATTGVVEMAKLELKHTSGTITLPYSHHTEVICSGSNGTTVQGSTLRVTEELQVETGHTYNSSAATLEFKVIDIHNGATVDFSGSLIEQKPSSVDGAISFGASANVTMLNKSGRGVAILGKLDTGEKTDVSMPADGDWFIVGGGQGGKHAMEDCRILTGSDITVQGTTLGLTFQEVGGLPTGSVHQFIQNIDSNHLLDADPTDDDDVSLPRPSLDNALQLQTGG